MLLQPIQASIEAVLLGVFEELPKGLGYPLVAEVEGGLQVLENLATDVVGEVGWGLNQRTSTQSIH